MSSRKSKKKVAKKSSPASKAKTARPKASRAPAGRRPAKAVAATKMIPHVFYEHQVYAAADAYSLVESSDPSELVRQVQIKCNEGWSAVGGICHSGQQFYQAMVKTRGH